jgi:hypothetical protein
VFKHAALISILGLLIAFWLAGCASPTNDTLASPSSSDSAAAVPGEKMSDDRIAPGPMGSTNVRW